MSNLIEIRWHGRGGQGAKTASLLLADAAFNTFVTNDYTSLSTKQKLNDAVLTAAGISRPEDNIKTGDGSSTTVQYANNRICVILEAKSGGTFYVTGDADYDNIAKSSGCPSE
mgnify:CR=1 FL=1